MSSHLELQIARLASDARRHRIHERRIISELTVIVGYAHLIGRHPEFADKLREHLEIFSQLTRAHEHHELCDSSAKILASLNGSVQSAA
jgi:hypothetical protein